MDRFDFESARFSISIIRSSADARWQVSMHDRMSSSPAMHKSLDGKLSLRDVKELAVLELLPTVVECGQRTCFASPSMRARRLWAYPRLWHGRTVVCQFLARGAAPPSTSEDAFRRSHVGFASRLVADVLQAAYVAVSVDDSELSNDDARNIDVVNRKTATHAMDKVPIEARLGGDDAECREALIAATEVCRLGEEAMVFIRATADQCYRSSEYGVRKAASFVEAYAGSDLHTTLGKSELLARAGRDEGSTWKAELQQAIRRPSGYSLIRAGEGEGCFLAYGRYARQQSRRNEAFGVIAKDIYKIWFHENIHELGDAAYVSLVADFLAAVESADYIGVPSQARIVYEFKSLASDLRHYGHSRGFFGIQTLVDELLGLGAEGRLKPCAIGDCDVARPLYHWQDPAESLATLLPKALYETADLVVIGCHEGLGELLRRTLSIGRVESIRIPGEKGRVNEQRDLGGSHLRDHYQSVLMQCDRMGGRTVLVAAGFLGKSYCARIKRAGGTAIDIGSLADFWIGQRTRAKSESTMRSPFPEAVPA